MEKAVQSCHQSIRQIKEKIQSATDELRSLQVPQKGDFSLYRQMQLLKQRVLDEISFNKHNLQVAETALTKAMQQLKTANIEHEKFIYLETTEIEKVLKAEKVKDAKALDEIALIGFNKRKNDA